MRLTSSFLAALATLSAIPATAQEASPIIGAPIDSGIGFQPAATELARDLQWLDGMILVIITAITLSVCALLAIVILRYNKRRNPNPAAFTHNTPVEVAWTGDSDRDPVLIGAFPLQVLLSSGNFRSGREHQGHRLPMVLGL